MKIYRIYWSRLRTFEIFKFELLFYKNQSIAFIAQEPRLISKLLIHGCLLPCNDWPFRRDLKWALGELRKVSQIKLKEFTWWLQKQWTLLCQPWRFWRFFVWILKENALISKNDFRNTGTIRMRKQRNGYLWLHICYQLD